MIQPNHFDRSKPFYPLILNYVIQLIGVKELDLRAVAGPRKEEDLLQSTLGRHSIEYGDPVEDQEALERLRRYLATLSGPLELRSEFQDGPIIVDIDEVARDYVENHGYVLEKMLPAAGSIFIVAYETAKAQNWTDVESPLWEFLRHCRNAAAHGGSFRLDNNQPKRPARWGHLEINRGLQGTPLFKDANGTGFLSLGDPIRLLWDIEQAYPHMQA